MIEKLLVLLFCMFATPQALGIEIVAARVDIETMELVLSLEYAPEVGPPADAITIDSHQCQRQVSPVATCEVKVIDRDRRYRYGLPTLNEHRFSLRSHAFNAPAYSNARLTIVADTTSVETEMPVLAGYTDLNHYRLSYTEDYSLGSAYQGFSNLVQHRMVANVVYGISHGFDQGRMNTQVIAYGIEDQRLRWSATLESGNSIRFVSASPVENLLVIGGRFVNGDSAQSNLSLFDAVNGESIRDFRGVEDLDVTSSYWQNGRILISHASKTDRQVSGTTIIDHGIVGGYIAWHDLQTGELNRIVESPLRQARVIEQSSDEQLVVFAGYEGAAIVNAITGEVVSSLHISDIYGSEFADCYNFGCGPNRMGFSHYDISADRRLFAVATRSGPIYVGDGQTDHGLRILDVVTPDGRPLYIRALKMDALGQRLYVYGAEEFTKPSNGHVLVYNLVNLEIQTWYQGPEVLGETGGTYRGSVFADDFRSLYSSDSHEGFADMAMLRSMYFRVYDLRR